MLPFPVLVGLVEDLDVELAAMVYVVSTATVRSATLHCVEMRPLYIQFQGDLRVRVLPVTPQSDLKRLGTIYNVETDNGSPRLFGTDEEQALSADNCAQRQFWHSMSPEKTWGPTCQIPRAVGTCREQVWLARRLRHARLGGRTQMCPP